MLSRRSGRSFKLLTILGLAVGSGCYTAGAGTDPPTQDLYFPVGLAVSKDGRALYVANSDFDLQWNGGTLQSYDLRGGGGAEGIRRAAVNQVLNPVAGCEPGTFDPARDTLDGAGKRRQPGDLCAPARAAKEFIRDSAIIGAFATDLQLSRESHASGDRLFIPVRGNASLTYADVADSDPFRIECNKNREGRCLNEAGGTENPANTRKIEMPGEPFGMAQSEDGSAIVITHQTEPKASLFLTGLTPRAKPTDPRVQQQAPSIQFVVENLPAGGNGVAAVPRDKQAFKGCLNEQKCDQMPAQAFLETSRASAELTLLRYHDDIGSSVPRPFLTKERSFVLTANSGGSDSRGIAIDDSPRRACKAKVGVKTGPGQPPSDEEIACARIPARVFIANRTPASLVIGEIGHVTATGAYDPDDLVIFGNVPLTAGPSRLYLAPIVDKEGRYALRVFIVCFDSSVVFVYDPDAGRIENTIRVGQGPFAMAFDPFNIDEVATHAEVAKEDGPPVTGTLKDASGKLVERTMRKYSFAYIASFTKSFIQVLDVDNTGANPTFEKVVFTLGVPTLPKGSR
jgi:hypothetical protein